MNRRRPAINISNLSGIFLWLACGFALVLVVLGAVKWLPSLLAPKFNQFERFNVVVAGPPTLLVSVSTSGKDAVEVIFPGDLYVDNVAHGYGKYRVAKIYAVGELDHRGGEVLTDTLSTLVGVPVDGFVDDRQMTSNIKSDFGGLNFLLAPHSNLNLWERIQLARSVSSIRADRIKTVDLGNNATKLMLADGSTVRSLAAEEIDNVLAGSFVLTNLESEKMRVEVLNSTDVPGLGNQAARVLTNVGASVINVDSSADSLKQCVVKSGKNNQSSITVQELVAVFGCKFEAVTPKENWDVLLTVGQDYADKLIK